MKSHFDSSHAWTTERFDVGDWVLVRKPHRVRKGESRYSILVQIKVNKAVILLRGKGWWNRRSLVKVTPKQAEIIKSTKHEDLS